MMRIRGSTYSPFSKSLTWLVVLLLFGVFYTFGFSSVALAADNAVCHVADMQEKYQSSCYSCLIVKTLLEQFMTVGTKTYALCSEAGVKILVLASCLWIAFFVLKNVSSLANVEPVSMINTLLTQLFKIGVAYIIIVSGTNTFINYVVNPILATGADYGLAIIDGVSETLNMQASGKYNYEGESLFSTDVMNKILGLAEGIDRVVSTNLVIGHALTCHSVNAGVWIFDLWVITISIPDIWIWLCGAVIWIFGFMMTLGVCYYLLDLSFKVGISIILFPITMGLWPFSTTSDKVISCVRTILKSAAIFAFLAITTSYGMTLISTALRDISEFYDRIENGDSQWISETFDITGSFFLVFVFAYFYAFLLISKTISSYVNKFFSGGILSGANPMHDRATQATDMAKRPVVATASYAKDVAREQGGRAVKGVGKGVGMAGKGMAQGGKSMMNAGKAMSSSGLGAIAGVPLMALGAVVAGTGYATQAAGKVTEKTGSMLKKSKDKPNKGGKDKDKDKDKDKNTNNDKDTENKPSNNPDNESNNSSGNNGGNNGSNNNDSGNNGGDNRGGSNDGGNNGNNGGGNNGGGNNGGDKGDDSVFNDYSKGYSEVVRDDKGHITSSRQFSADGRLRGTFSEDKDGNKHYQSFGADGKLTGEHHRNKDGSSSGWQKTGDTMVTWSKDGQGNGESRNYYKGELLSGTTTKDGQTTRWEA